MLTVELYCSSYTYKAPCRRLPGIVRQAACQLPRKCHLAELSIAIVGDKKMSDLHKAHLNIAGPTDVLTFPLAFDARNRPIAGEIIICFPYARRTAKAHNIPLWKELSLYTVHGLLHLSGYDDLTPAQYKQMHAKEDRILNHLGLGKVFRAAHNNHTNRTT